MGSRKAAGTRGGAKKGKKSAKGAKKVKLTPEEHAAKLAAELEAKRLKIEAGYSAPRPGAVRVATLPGIAFATGTAQHKLAYCQWWRMPA